MTLNWKALTPHRPLDPGEPGYVPPPSDYAARLARLVTAGATTILVGGPVGVGKSTELARVQRLLQDSRVCCLVHLDRYENIRRLTPDRALLRIAGTLVEFALESLKLYVSRSTRAALAEAGVLHPRLLENLASLASKAGKLALEELMSLKLSTVNGEESTFAPFQGSAISLAQAAINEVAHLSQHMRVTFVIDGLEKLPEGPGGLEILSALGQLGEDVDLIVAVPWFVAFGGPDDVVRPGGRFLSLPASEVDGNRGDPGRWFLLDILARRLGLPAESFDPAMIRSVIHGDANHQRELAQQRRDLILEAAQHSGGIPRTFLQLMADAAQYAQIRRGDDWPNKQDLADAIADQRDSFRRVLLPGDTEAIRRCDGTDGREMELGRKIRLLARGVLLERNRDGQWVIDVHPLVRPLLGGVSGA